MFDVDIVLNVHKQAPDPKFGVVRVTSQYVYVNLTKVQMHDLIDSAFEEGVTGAISVRRST